MMLCYLAMSHGSYELNLGPKKLVLARDMRLRSWPNIDGTYGKKDLSLDNNFPLFQLEKTYVVSIQKIIFGKTFI